MLYIIYVIIPVEDRLLRSFKSNGLCRAEVCRMALAHEHLAAEKVYLELTIGNSQWPIGGGEFLSSDGPQPGASDSFRDTSEGKFMEKSMKIHEKH